MGSSIAAAQAFRPKEAQKTRASRRIQASTDAGSPGPLWPLLARQGAGPWGGAPATNANRSRYFGRSESGTPPAAPPGVGEPRVQCAPLAVGAPDDPQEREADAVAARASRTPARPPDPPPKRWEELHGSGTPAIRREPAGGGVPAVDDRVRNQVQSPPEGAPLSDPMRARMEPLLGVGLGHVRVHEDGGASQAAQALAAKAFTHGHHIWLGSGQSASDVGLMAHELTHVAQQGGAVRRKEQQPGAPVPPPARGPGPASSEPATATGAPVPPETDETATATATAETSDVATAVEAHLEGHGRGEAAATKEAHTPGETPATAPDEGQAAEAAPASPPAEGAPPPPETAAPPAHDAAPPAEPASGEEPTPQADAQGDPPGADARSLAAPSPSTAPPPPPSEPSAAPAAPAAPAIQRDEDEGVIAGIRHRINQAVTAVRSGWDSLSGVAGEAVETVRAQAGGLAAGLRGALASAMTGVRGAWSAMSARATRLATGVKELLAAPVTAAINLGRQVAAAVRRLDAGGARAAFAAVTASVGAVWQRLEQIGRAVMAQIAALWGDVQVRFGAVMRGVAAAARAALDRLLSVARAVGQRLARLWDALRTRAAEMTEGLNRVVRAIIETLLSWAQRIWSGIQRQWAALKTRLASVLGGIGRGFQQMWDGLRRGASRIWAGIQRLWVRLRTWAGRVIQRLGSALRSLANRFRGNSGASFFDRIAKAAPFVKAVEAAVANPDAAMMPLVHGLAAPLQAGMPAKAIEIGRNKMNEQAGPQATAPATATGAATPVVRRVPLTAVPHTITSPADISDGFVRHIKAKWAALEIGKMIKDMLWSLIWPWPAVGQEFVLLWTVDWTNAANRLYVPRNPLHDPLGTLQDLWTNLLHLLDFVLALWRRLNNVLMLLMGWITVALVLIGAFVPAIAGTIIGGILSAAVSVGIATPAGAAAGAGAGGTIGAAAGLAAAGALGMMVLASFAVAHGITIVKTLVTLLSGLLTDDEKEDDYSQLADSLLGLGIGAALVVVANVLSWLVSRLASMVVDFARGVRASIARRAATAPPATTPPSTTPPATTPPAAPPGTAPPVEDPAAPARDPEAPSRPAPNVPIRARLAEFYRRLGAGRRTATPRAALEDIQRTLDDVEDELSGVPKRNPPPAPNEFDGRMYPPLEDNVRPRADGGLDARTRGHRIELAPDGSVTIRNARTGEVEFSRPGAGRQVPIAPPVPPRRDDSEREGEAP